MAEKYTLERPATRERLIGFVVDGMSDADAALAISTPTRSVTPQAITKFRERHIEAITAKQQALTEALHHRWIADKDARLGKLQDIYAGLDDVRANYGFMVTTEDVDENGETKIYTQHFNGQLAAQMRGVLSDASDELGQKPRPPESQPVAVAVQVNLSWADGTPA